MKKANIQLETLTCPSCTQKIEASLQNLDGVDKESIKIRFNASRVMLNFDSNKITIEDIEKAISSLGFIIEKSNIKVL